ncbi:MAG: hypothetical protein WB615_12500, partial [Candidatus Tumulicola sp.]
MKRLGSLIGAYLLTALLIACGGGSNGFSLTTAPASIARQIAAQRSFSAGSNLYVANLVGDTVTVYAPGSGAVLRTISHGVNEPEVLAFDGSGDLYVANDSYRYPRNRGGSVTVYAPGKTRARLKIGPTQGVNVPKALAFDGSGNLYVANGGGNTVTAYAPGSGTVLRTISQGVNVPAGLAFDGSGNLYVANGGANTVTVYAPGSGTILRTISQDVNGPRSLVFDGSGNLYVANRVGNTVTVYAPGSGAVLRTISQSVYDPGAL